MGFFGSLFGSEEKPPVSTPAPAPAPNYSLAPPSQNQCVAPPAVDANAQQPVDPNAQKTADPNAPKPVDPKVVAAAANSLFKAMDGWGTDEDAVHNALRGKSPAEIAAIRAEYKDHFGRDLDDDVKDEMGGKDGEEAMAMLSGDPVQAAVAALDNAANGGLTGWGTDEDKIKTVLRGVSDPEQRAQVMAAYEQKTGVKLDKMLKDEMSSYDLAESQALLEGDTSKAAAVRMDEAMNGGFLGTGWGTDEDAINKAIEECKDPAEREKLAAAYKERTGQELNTALQSELSGAELDVSTALMAGDTAGAAAARLQVAMDGLGTDEEGIFAQLENKSPEERKALVEAYNKKYGKDGQDFDSMLKGELSDLELQKAEMLRDNGKVSDEFALKYAMDAGFMGWGTDEATIRKVFDGKSKDEIDALKRTYATTYGQDLDAQLSGEISGRDGFEIGQLMKGKPQTPEEIRDRANEAWEFERGSGSNWFSTGVMDIFSNKGAVLDRQHSRINEAFTSGMGDGQISDAEKARLEQLSGYQGQDVKNYQESKDSVTSTAATAAAILAAAGTTALTGGGAAPAWAAFFGTYAGAASAATAALAGGGASMLTKWAIQDQAYGREDIAADAVKTLGSAATAGALKLPGFDNGLNAMLGIEKGITPTLMQGIEKGVITGSLGGLSGGLVGGLVDEKNYGKGFDEWLGGMVKGGAFGALTGGVSGAAGAATSSALGEDSTLNPYIWGALRGAGSGVVGRGAGLPFDPKAFSGRWEDIAQYWGKTAFFGAAGGALGGLNGQYAKDLKSSSTPAATSQPAASTPAPAPAAPTPAPAVTTAPTVDTTRLFPNSRLPDEEVLEHLSR